MAISFSHHVHCFDITIKYRGVEIKSNTAFVSTGLPISTMFLSPGVTPWETTLPGVVDGANNPGIRVFEYDTKTLLVRVSNSNSTCNNFSASHYRQTTAFSNVEGCFATSRTLLVLIVFCFVF